MATYEVAIDDVGVGRATDLLPLVQETVPEAVLQDVYNGAAVVGLNRLCSHIPSRIPTAEDIEYVDGIDTSLINVTVSADDMERAESLADSLSVSPNRVIGSATMTGLALLRGTDTMLPPFTVVE